jgi:transcriptional regulator with XRE-family HTH domain
MFKESKTLKRIRGVILSDLGWQRLQAAKQQSELKTNARQPYTLEEISAQTGLSHNTLSKVHQRKGTVDRQTLEIYFRSFGLVLQPSDFIRSVHDQPSVDLAPQQPILNLGSLQK